MSAFNGEPESKVSPQISGMVFDDALLKIDRAVATNPFHFRMNTSAIKLSLTLLFACTVAAAQAEEEKFNPESVMLSHFSFVRPKNWKWDENKSGDKKKDAPEADGVIREIVFRINDSTGEKTNSASAYFNLYPASSDIATSKATAKRWKKWFKESRASDPVVSSAKVGSNKVVWLELHGIYWTGRTNAVLFGAIIEDKEGNILARLDGSADVVEKNKRAFKKMVADALKPD
jgi:hypothetical protein